VTVAGANTHDMKKMVEKTLESIVVERPEPNEKHPQNICMDKGYDFPEVDELVAEWGYTAHIARRGIDQSKLERIPGRLQGEEMGVERTNSWMNRFRRLLIRWEKKRKNYLAMIHISCTWITYHRTGIIG
jgi:putative transposase